jgi:hypothetical protein
LAQRMLKNCRRRVTTHRHTIMDQTNVISKLLGSPTALAASILWSIIGFAYALYGKKQQAIIPRLGGIGMMLVPYFCSDSALIMSLINIGIAAAVYWFRNYE